MDTPRNVIGATMRAARPFDDASPLPEDWRLARTARVNLLLMGMPPVNPLLTDLDCVIRNVLERFLPDLHEPVASWCPGERLALPPHARARTMILHDVGALSRDEQLELLDWLSRAGGQTQVVSTTSAPLLPRVQEGAFIDMLYYRLNTVCVDVTA